MCTFQNEDVICKFGVIYTGVNIGREGATALNQHTQPRVLRILAVGL